VLPDYCIVQEHLPKDLPGQVVLVMVTPAKLVVWLIGNLQQQQQQQLQ
jgi:hypothetical protein